MAAKLAFLEPALPIDIVGTGMPEGIWTMESRLSKPERALYKTQEPDWLNDNKIRSKHNMNFMFADGYKVFKNTFDYFK